MKWLIYYYCSLKEEAGDEEAVAPKAALGIKKSTTSKKSSTVSQAHMCNYCNYTSPKR